MEIHLRDKNNTRRRLMFVDGQREIAATSMHARIPNGMIIRDSWVNLCIDVNSFVKDCFSRSTVTGTP